VKPIPSPIGRFRAEARFGAASFAAVWLALLAAIPAGAADGADRGKALLQRLSQGQATRIVAFGDSITAGWGVADPARDTYQDVFAWALQERFSKAPIELVSIGMPGKTSGDALRVMRAEVVDRNPDLVIVQFGGNDKGWGRTVGQYRADLRRVLQAIAEQTRAAVICCVPPIVDPNLHNPFADTARQVAAEADVAIADFDAAIRSGDHDFRGPFPYTEHPDDFTHAILAREVMAAFDRLTGVPAGVTVELVGGARTAQLGQSLSIPLRVINPDQRPVVAHVKVDVSGKLTVQDVKLDAGATAEVSVEVALPRELPLGRAYSQEIRATASTPEQSSFDVKWLTLAPIAPVQTATQTGRAERTAIGGSCVVSGRELWRGPADSSALFSIQETREALQFDIHVDDDDITLADLKDPAQGDAVEVYLDARKAADQGKPVYGPDVVGYLIMPPADGGGCKWRLLDGQTGPLSRATVTGKRVPGGYEVQLAVPLEALKAARGGDWPGMGVDVAIDDADFGGSRKCQLFWSGTALDYVSARYFGGLERAPCPPGAVRAVVR